MEEFYLLTFKNTHDAIGCEKLLKEKKLMLQIMPTPTSMTKSCGISIKVSKESIEEIKALINRNELSVKVIYLYIERQFTVINIDK
ncbi:MAG: DUF3343 domain-containing protein [Clostridiaceae bacterium]|nr:DUF3343 domain-containing protein [Clostridiaceae bacterium]